MIEIHINMMISQEADLQKSLFILVYKVCERMSIIN